MWEISVGWNSLKERWLFQTQTHTRCHNHWLYSDCQCFSPGKIENPNWRICQRKHPSKVKMLFSQVQKNEYCDQQSSKRMKQDPVGVKGLGGEFQKTARHVLSWIVIPVVNCNNICRELTTPEKTITYHNALCLSPKILHKHFLQFLLGIKMAPRETENNAYAQFFFVTKKEHYGMLCFFSGVVNCNNQAIVNCNYTLS